MRTKQKGFTLLESRMPCVLMQRQRFSLSAMNTKSDDSRKLLTGFTLIEILLVIGIIAVLATVVIVALDPAKRFADARDSRRLSDIQSILSATQQYIVDNKGVLPAGLDSTARQIGTTTSGCSISGNCSVTAASCLNMSTDLAKYLKSLPYDPANGSAGTTHYSIVANSNNIVTVTACDSTDTTIAAVSR
jgi:prepilin-type N-terminal cleavage/methylation domain-containing protein